MKGVTRREFLNWIGLSGAAVGLLEAMPLRIAEAMEAAVEEYPLVWLQLSNCSGCSISAINTIHPSIKNVLLDQIIPNHQLSLRFQQTVMAGSGDPALRSVADTHEKWKGRYILIVEGAIPTKDAGAYGTMGEHDAKPITQADHVRRLAPDALAVLALGTCASYGGVAAAAPNPSGAVGVGEFFVQEGINTPLINIPGCPSHPDWFIGTVAHVLLLGLPTADQLDRHGRMKLFFGTTVHRACTNRDYMDEGIMAQRPGDIGCLIEIGCKGPYTMADCPRRSWNSGVNWCIGSGGPCLGCTEPGFPDEFCPFLELA